MNQSRRLGHLWLVLPSLLMLSACATRQPNAELTRRLDSILHERDDGNVKYTARVVEIASGRELYAHEVDQPFMPASNGKLAVGAAALDYFGAAHTFPTYLAMDGDDLWLIGTGDPGTGDNIIARKYGGTTMTVLDEFTDALQTRNVQRIRGELYYYDGALDGQRVHPSWSKSFLTDWYAAPIAGLNFNNNCIDVTVSPTSDDQPATVAVIPPTKAVKVMNECTTGQKNDAALEREADADVFKVTGSTTRPMELKSKPITDPGAFFADALRTHLESRGITIDGKTKRATVALGGSLVPPSDNIIAVHETRMTDALARINKQSQNSFAEAFCKMLGKAYRAEHGTYEPGSWRAGAEATKAFLERNRIDTSKLAIVDGSGLSRDNRVTARMITDLMVVMFNHPDGKAYLHSLCVAGHDGTLSSRMKDLRGHVFGKTGFIGGVRSLSGYVQTKRGKWLAFSIIYNGIEGGVKPFEQMQDDACRVLVEWPELREDQRPRAGSAGGA